MDNLTAYLHFCKNILLHPIAFLDVYFPEDRRKVETTIEGKVVSEEIIALPILQRYAKSIATWGYAILMALIFTLQCKLALPLLQSTYDTLDPNMRNVLIKLVNGSFLTILISSSLSWGAFTYVSFYLFQWCFSKLSSILPVKLSTREAEGLFAYIRAHMVLIFSIVGFAKTILFLLLRFKGQEMLFGDLAPWLHILPFVWYIYFVAQVSKTFFGQIEWRLALPLPLLSYFFL